jgi:hypothetical protein
MLHNILDNFWVAKRQAASLAGLSSVYVISWLMEWKSMEGRDKNEKKKESRKKGGEGKMEEWVHGGAEAVNRQFLTSAFWVQSQVSSCGMCPIQLHWDNSYSKKWATWPFRLRECPMREQYMVMGSERLHWKVQTRPLVREGALLEEATNCQTEENVSGLPTPRRNGRLKTQQLLQDAMKEEVWRTCTLSAYWNADVLYSLGIPIIVARHDVTLIAFMSTCSTYIEPSEMSLVQNIAVALFSSAQERYGHSEKAAIGHWSNWMCSGFRQTRALLGASSVVFWQRIYFLIPFYLQAVQIHLANVVKLLLLQAWRGVLSSTPPYK